MWKKTIKIQGLKYSKPKGFSLMEMVVVTAVFTTTTLIAVDVFMSVAKTQRQVRSVQAVQSDSNFTLESMAKEIRGGTIDYDYYKGVCQIYSDQTPDNPGDPCTPGVGNECFLLGGNFAESCQAINLISSTYILATRDQDNNQIFYRRTANLDGSPGAGDKIEVCSNNSQDFTRCNLYHDGQIINNWQNVTPPEVNVDNLKFYITPTSNPYSKKNSCSIDDDCDSGDCENHLCVIPDTQPMVTIVLQAESGTAVAQEKVNLQTTITSSLYRR